MAATVEDRRAHPRRTTVLEAWLHVPDSGHHTAVTLRDLSIGGALIEATHALQSGAEYLLRVDVSGRDINLPLRVVRRHDADSLQWGCAFAGADPQLHAERAELLAHVAGDEPIDTSDILSDLVRTTRYELRTPLNHIIGCSELLQEQAAETGADSFLPGLEHIRTAARGLLAWLTATLDLSKVAAGELEASLLNASMIEPVEAIAAHCARLLEAAQAQWPDAVADLRSIHEATAQLRELMDRVIDLSHFEIDEAAGQLPADRALALQAIARLRLASQRAHGEAGQRLLVVDANEAHRSLLARRLARLGYDVSLAPDGFQALDLLRAESFDLVLLDVMLPEMSGADVLEAMKADKDLAELPVIMLSALDQIEWVAHCIEMGAEDYLPKPYEPMVLQARVDASLEKRRLRAQEVEYLRAVAHVTNAAAAVESASFDLSSLDPVAARDDGLGNLARVFQRMAREVKAREDLLKQQVQQLRIEIDQAKRQQAVDEIVDSDYFRHLQQQANALREQR